MEIAGKKVLIVGLGKTGEALARFLLRREARVTISEIRSEDELGKRGRFWRDSGAAVEFGRHDARTFLASDLIIPSPGAAALPELQAAKRAGIKVLSDIELASRFLSGKIVGITGTNGKSTTATLTHRILKEAGLKSFLAGNIGTPLISFVDRSRRDHIYVTEISSFQLEHVDRFKADISVFLNISLNHLDWHDSFETYFEAKKKLVLGQGEMDIAILNRDDRLVRRLAGEIRARVYYFSRRQAVRRGCYVDDDELVLRDDGRDTRLMKSAEIPLPGGHNAENAMAAALVGHCLDVSARSIRSSIRSFSGLEHRLEKVLTLQGVEFVNDSKATTVDAAIKALESFDRTVVLILGGRDKGSDFRLLRRPVRKKVKKIILLGEATPKIKPALRGTVPTEEARSLGEAVRKSYAAAAPGEIVLLAPACTSFDMFRNFEARGRAFKREIRRLAASIRGART
jgi:UDP-N-acetylmuramoylalanine--D-glutamate ligase